MDTLLGSNDRNDVDNDNNDNGGNNDNSKSNEGGLCFSGTELALELDALLDDSIGEEIEFENVEENEEEESHLGVYTEKFLKNETNNTIATNVNGDDDAVRRLLFKSPRSSEKMAIYIGKKSNREKQRNNNNTMIAYDKNRKRKPLWEPRRIVAKKSIDAQTAATLSISSKSKSNTTIVRNRIKKPVWESRRIVAKKSIDALNNETTATLSMASKSKSNTTIVRNRIKKPLWEPRKIVAKKSIDALNNETTTTRSVSSKSKSNTAIVRNRIKKPLWEPRRIVAKKSIDALNNETTTTLSVSSKSKSNTAIVRNRITKGSSTSTNTNQNKIPITATATATTVNKNVRAASSSTALGSSSVRRSFMTATFSSKRRFGKKSVDNRKSGEEAKEKQNQVRGLGRSFISSTLSSTLRFGRKLVDIGEGERRNEEKMPNQARGSERSFMSATTKTVVEYPERHDYSFESVFSAQSCISLSSQCTVESFVSPTREGMRGCQSKFDPFLHKDRLPCELCLFRLSEKEKEKLDEQGRHLLVQFTTGGCRDCQAFSKSIHDSLVTRLCRKCHYASHREAPKRCRKKGNDATTGYSFAKVRLRGGY